VRDGRQGDRTVDQLRKHSRVAGLLYLFVVLLGPFTLIYVPGKLFVPGDGGATARNILAHEPLFRVFTVVEIVSELLFVLTVLALYRLLRAVGQQLASVMAILVLIDAPLAFLGVVNHLATLTIARGGEFLGAFSEPQRSALIALLLAVDRQSTLVSEVFWGLWLIPLGLLVYRSGFLPRLLGGWLIMNGVAYVAMSLAGLLLPQYAKTVFTVATPVLFGEAAFMLWLLIVGARVRPSPDPAS
jgi:hypothetical protein